MAAALYRRYRPESFSEMIGQSQVTDPLMTALRNGKVGHAYLFSGPRGCGKTTSARILARCLNCVEGPTDTPCNVCPSCVELSRDGGGSLDVVEIDAASHGGVDDARDLRERAVFAPARDRFKIFIIDEAHMVTSAGFNALLKIVEEPPPHVKFVFATTEPEKVIGTIRSRTHHYPFRLIAPGALIDYVQGLCDSEGVGVEPGVLPLVVRAGGGSARDTLSILDQLIAGSEGDFVTAERAAGLLGYTGSELLDDVVTAFGAGDAAAAFAATDRVVQTGQDPRRFVEDLLERLRDLIVISATSIDGAAAVFRGVAPEQLSRMFEQAQAFGHGELSRIADVTSDALGRMVGATAPRLQLELMIARALVALENMRGAAPVAGGFGAAPAQRMPQAQPVQQTAQPGHATQAPASQQGFGARGAAPAAPAAQAAPVAQATQATQAAPAAPKVDPISALAAARNAVSQPAAQAPVAHAPAAQPAPAAQQAQQPQGASGQQQQAGQQSSPTAQPNAAQTAASIREFLATDTAGAPGQSPAAGQNSAPGQSPAAGQNPAVGQVPAAGQNLVQGQGDPTAQQPQRPQQAPAGQQQSPQQVAQPSQIAQCSQPAAGTLAQQPAGAPHPNEGAAKFGRPISDILSAAQIASIGTEPTKPAPQAAAPTTQPAQPTQQVVTPGAAAVQPVAVPNAQGVHPAQSGESNEDEFDDQAGGFDDLLEVWPDLLEEILEQDRNAWNAVKPVQPLALDGDVLSVGLSSQSDLQAFKAAGAGPLREAILSAVGITVRYAPKQTQQGSAPSTPGAQREPEAEEPHRVGSPTASPTAKPAPSDDPVERAAKRLSALGPALAAPAWADPVAPGRPQPAAAPPQSNLAVQPAAQPGTSAEPARGAQPPKQQAAQDRQQVPAVSARTAPDSTLSAAAPGGAAAQPVGGEVSQEVHPETPHAPSAQPAGAGSAAGIAAPAAATTLPAAGAPSVAAAPAQPTQQGSTAQPGNPAQQNKPSQATKQLGAAEAAATRFQADDPYANDPYAGESSLEPDEDPWGEGSYTAPAVQPSKPPVAPPQPSSSASAGAASPQAPVTPSTAPSTALPATTAEPESTYVVAPAAKAGPATTPAAGPAARVEPNAAATPASPASAASPAAPAQQGSGAEPSIAEQLAATAAEAPTKSAPSFTRYGEAVVRETLGAKFIEELPLAGRAQ